MTPAGDTASAPVLVHARGLRFDYGDRRILDGVDLDIRAGDEIAVSGRSGSGKTTLLLALAGLLPVPARDGAALDWPGLAAGASARRALIAMVFQAPSLVPELTAVENVTLPLRLRGATRVAARRAALDALGDVGLGDAADALPAELSGGQQQRVALARALAGNPLLLLADEPTGALDAATAADMLALARARMRRTGGALLVATHDPETAARLPVHLDLSGGTLRERRRPRTLTGQSTGQSTGRSTGQPAGRPTEETNR